MSKRFCRPPNPNPLAPYEKVHPSEIDQTVVTIIAFACTSIGLVVEAAIFTLKVFQEAEHMTLDKVIAWTFVAWAILLFAGCIRIFGSSETTYPGP